MSSTSFPASADSPSDSKEPVCEPLPSARSTPTAAQSSQNDGLEYPCTEMSANSAEPMSGQSSLFVEGSPASLSASQEKDWVAKMTVTSGLSIAGLSKNSGPLGLLEKMLLGSSTWASTPCLMIWRAQATPQGRLIYRLAELALRTDVNESGLWLTPTAADAANRTFSVNSRGEPKLSAQVKLWPTPLTVRENDSDNTAGRYYPNKRQFDLAAAVHLWATPAATDAKGAVSLEKANKRAEESSRGVRLPEQVTLIDQCQVGGSLNPEWVEWLMGFPIGHTVLEPSETPSSRRSRKSSAGQS